MEVLHALIRDVVSTVRPLVCLYYKETRVKLAPPEAPSLSIKLPTKSPYQHVERKLLITSKIPGSRSEANTLLNVSRLAPQIVKKSNNCSATYYTNSEKTKSLE